MSKFLIMPEELKWYEIDLPVKDLEQAYRMECAWFSPNKRIAIRDLASGQIKIFIRKLASSGDLEEVITL